jgi:LysR family hydrogen peroxide-inducible transcriptional activator
MIRPSLRQLSYLIAIDEEGSFSGAAEICAVTQSTLSAGIKELEAILGQKLVIRGRRKTALSPFGLEVAQNARDVLEGTDRIVARAKLMKNPLSGPLRLGIIPTIAPYMLPSILPTLQKHFPALELQLHEDLTGRLLEQLHKGHIDVALMAFPFKTQGMTQKLLFEEKFFIATPAHHTTQAMDIRDLEPEKLLLLDDGHCLRDHALLACDLQLPRRRKAFSATSLPTLIQMVSHGFGITLLPEMACAPDTLPAGVRILPFKGKHTPRRQIGLCWRQGDPRSKDYETLGETIK